MANMIESARAHTTCKRNCMPLFCQWKGWLHRLIWCKMVANGESIKAVSRKSGITPNIISQFMHGKYGIGMYNLARLLPVIGLYVVEEG